MDDDDATDMNGSRGASDYVIKRRVVERRGWVCEVSRVFVCLVSKGWRSFAMIPQPSVKHHL